MAWERFQCPWCGRVTSAAPGVLCRVCDELVTCQQCTGARRAPPLIGVCERCRRRNGVDHRLLYEAAHAVARLDLVELPARVPLLPGPATPAELRELAAAARPLAAAARRLAAGNVVDPLAELRDAPRKPPRRAPNLSRSAGRSRGGR